MSVRASVSVVVGVRGARGSAGCCNQVKLTGIRADTSMEENLFVVTAMHVVVFDSKNEAVFGSKKKLYLV